MSRRYADPVEVRVGQVQIGVGPVLPAGLDLAAVPTAFIWRGRLHVVRVVQHHWVQRMPWWRGVWDSSTPSPDSQRDQQPDPLPDSQRNQQPDPLPDSQRNRQPDSLPQLEREVWRVEASAGRLLQTGVYDLTKDDRWRLVRVAD